MIRDIDWAAARLAASFGNLDLRENEQNNRAARLLKTPVDFC